MLLSVSGFCLADNAAPSSFELHSQTRVKGFQVTAVQTLTVEDGIYRLQQTTRAPVLNIEETSVFRLDEQQHIVPVSYDYQRSVFGKKLSRKNRFSDDRTSATFQENKQTAITIATPEPVTDQLNFIIAVQQWLKTEPPADSEKIITLVDDKRVREHHYRLVDNEWLHTSLGWLETTVIERIRPNSDKRTRIWLAKDWEYLVVKMQHYEDDEGEQTIYLQKGLLDGKAIKGLSEKPVADQSGK